VFSRALIGDRFITGGDGWCDLATARSVDLEMFPIADGHGRTQARVASATAWTNGTRRLLATGEHDAAAFEAWTAREDPGEPDFVVRHLVRRASASIVERAAAHVDACIRTIAVVTHRGAGTAAVVADAACGLRDLGFVTVCAEARVDSALREALCHRHVVVVDTAVSRGRGETSRWIHHLSRASRRGHLVLTIRAELPPDAPAIVIEPCPLEDLVQAFMGRAWQPPDDVVVRAAAASEGWPGLFVRALEEARRASAHTRGRQSTYAMAPDRRLMRAMSLGRQGRPSASTRWSVAALQAAQRRQDPVGAVDALEQVAATAHPHEWPSVFARARELLRGPSVPELHMRILAVTMRLHLASGDVRHAESRAAEAEAEAAVSGIARSLDDATLRCELCFWQGRFDSGSDVLAAWCDAPAAALWRALLAWARGERMCGDHLPVLGSEAQERTRVWGAAAQVFAAADADEASSGTDRGRVIVATALAELRRQDPDGRHAELIRAVAAEAWLRCGAHARAREVLRRGAESTAGDLWAALALRLRRAAEDRPDAAADRRLRQLVARAGCAGVLRWGRRRNAMDVQGVSALFEIVHEADDAKGALTRAVAWARDAAQASAVTLVNAADGHVIAADPGGPSGPGGQAARQDTDEERWRVCVETGRPVASHEDGLVWCAAPVRFGGVVMAIAVGRGTADRARALPEVMAALSAACAPWVRERLDTMRVGQHADALHELIAGTSGAIAAVREAAARAAGVPFPVLIEGESGTGKELVARALHRLGPRRDRRMCSLNCAAITDELVEAELFGHTRGAFTGATSVRAGLFEEAHQSTLFLDEVAELSPRAQAKLLRVLQEGEIRRLGENAPRLIDVRVVAATNRPLRQAARDGQFREDLLFRLAVIRIVVPPLRERLEDIPLLAGVFWREVTRQTGSRAQLSPDAIAALSRHTWPGNVRQLQNVVAGLVVAAPSRGRVLSRHVAQVLDAHGGGSAVMHVPLEAARQRAERQAVAAALARHAGCRRMAASELGLSRQGLTKAIRRLGLKGRSDTAGVA
jgi:DNA-binding NtrC family response regulator